MCVRFMNFNRFKYIAFLGLLLLALTPNQAFGYVVRDSSLVQATDQQYSHSFAETKKSETTLFESKTKSNKAKRRKAAKTKLNGKGWCKY